MDIRRGTIGGLVTLLLAAIPVAAEDRWGKGYRPEFGGNAVWPPPWPNSGFGGYATPEQEANLQRLLNDTQVFIDNNWNRLGGRPPVYPMPPYRTAPNYYGPQPMPY